MSVFSSIQIVTQIASALEYLGSKDLVHLRINAASIFVVAPGKVHDIWFSDLWCVLKNDDFSSHFYIQKCLAVLMFRTAEKVSKYQVFFFFEMMSEHIIEDVKMFWKQLAKKKASNTSHQSLTFTTHCPFRCYATR